MRSFVRSVLYVLCIVFLGVAVPSGAPRYSLAFASFGPLDTDIFLADADGNNARPLLPHPDLDYNASFSHDGRWIIFTSQRNGSPDIYKVHPDGTSLQRLTDDPAFDDQAALSPDGRMLTFVSTRSGQADIWVLDLGTKKLKNLTNHPGGDFRPTWSPDGQWIAFSSDRNSQNLIAKSGFNTLHSTEVYAMRADGSGLRRITYNNQFAGSPSWSPDGTEIAFYEADLAAVEAIVSITDNPEQLHGITQIVTVNVRTGERHVVTTGPGEKWSPRWGAHAIGYASGGSSSGIEFTTGSAGARGSFWSPDWSPDGRQMVFHREVGHAWPPLRRWYSRDARFGLVRTGIFPSYDSTGGRMVVNSGAFGIVHNGLLLMKADGSGRSTLFDDPQKSALGPAWAPHGERIAFALGSFFPGIQSRGVPISNLALINGDGTGFTLLTKGDTHDGFPAWSPDGRRIVFRRAGDSGKGLRLLNVDTGDVTVLTEGPHNDNFPSWSPKGDLISFTSNRDGDYEIYTIRPDGTDLKRLTHSPGNDAHAVWSPDGAWLAFACSRGFKDEAPLHPHNSQPYGEICVVRGDGSDVRVLTDDPFEVATPTWIP